jgi:hypothetical protein
MATGVTMTRYFPARILGQLCDGKSLRIRAGTGAHRFIGIGVVVVKDRVFVRSGERQTERLVPCVLLRSQRVIRIADRDIPIVAVPIADKRMLDAIDRTYLVICRR